MVANSFHVFPHLKMPRAKRESCTPLALWLQSDLDCGNSFIVLITYII